MTASKLRKLLEKGGRFKIFTEEGSSLYATGLMTHWIISGSEYGFRMAFSDVRILPVKRNHNTKKKGRT